MNRLLVPVVALAILAGACSSDSSSADPSASSDAAETTDTAVASSPSETAPAAVENGDGFFDASAVHEISVEFDTDDYEAVIQAYVDSGDKEWIEATVTIDGETYEQVGMRLKGNSSLRSLVGGSGGPSGTVSDDDPTSLPWLIRLDEFVDGQEHDGVTDFVVRSNNSETSLNEAVALDLLEAAGLASQDAVAVRFSVNGSEQRLRLVVENPDDAWMADELSASGALYKAESTGDYSYRGDDPESYDEVFDQEAGEDNADLTPLIDFLQFLDEADDETFAAELPERLDVEAFATYLAMQDLLDNFDDIDGPGNNSYLYYDTETEQFTVVPWDHNLAFGGGGFGAPGGGSGGIPAQGPGQDGNFPAPPDGTFPTPPDGATFGGPGGGFAGGPGGRSNILVERFLAVDEFTALYQQAVEDLTAELYDSGLAADVLASWVAVLEDGAADLVDTATIQSEADAIGTYF